ncbi:MAG: hypothetical protein ACT4PU_09085 [Planctomycetota bacterium]
MRTESIALLACLLSCACAGPSADKGGSPPSPAPAQSPADSPISSRTLTALLDSTAPETKPDVHDPHRLLGMASFEAWHAHIAPQPAELAWASLPWRTSYAEGLAAAQEQRRPLLLWVMNGHPLGCT